MRERFSTGLSLLLALVLLAGCGAAPVPAQTAGPTPGAEQVQETEATPEPAPARSGVAELTSDTVLFIRQADLDAKQGVLVPRAEAEAAAYFPRTHRYDGEFSSEADQSLLRLLDYCFSNGNVGFSVLPGELSAAALSTRQRRALELMYPIDRGKVCGLDRADCVSFWYDCPKTDTMEYFSQGLTAAVVLAGTLPIGPDEYENARVIWMALKDRIEYGDRDTYYYNYGHQLYDALVGGVCVCSGYGDAVYYLFNLCGIDCVNVLGLASSLDAPGGLDDHKWNVARLCGADYCFDLTWDDTAELDGMTGFFGLSDSTLNLLGGHRRTGSSLDELVPVCPRCFDPAAVWNDSPAGALRSWLWFHNECARYPEKLLVLSGLFEGADGFGSPEDGWCVTGIPFADFQAYSAEFMTGDCFAAWFEERYREEADGSLAFRISVPEEPEYRLVSVDGETAVLWDAAGTEYAARFTVEEADGQSLVSSIEITTS